MCKCIDCTMRKTLEERAKNELLKAVFNESPQGDMDADLPDPSAKAPKNYDELRDFLMNAKPGTALIDEYPERGWMLCDAQTHRIYHYPGGYDVTILGPQLQVALDNGDELVYDDTGMSHHIKAGFMSVQWGTKPGRPNFQLSPVILTH